MDKRQSLYGIFWFGRSLFFEARIDTNSKMKDLTPFTSPLAVSMMTGAEMKKMELFDLLRSRQCMSRHFRFHLS
jgi:hypothetical protein